MTAQWVVKALLWAVAAVIVVIGLNAMIEGTFNWLAAVVVWLLLIVYDAKSQSDFNRRERRQDDARQAWREQCERNEAALRARWHND